MMLLQKELITFRSPKSMERKDDGVEKFFDKQIQVRPRLPRFSSVLVFCKILTLTPSHIIMMIHVSHTTSILYSPHCRSLDNWSAVYPSTIPTAQT